MGRRKERGLGLKKTLNLGKHWHNIISVSRRHNIKWIFFPHKRDECFVFQCLAYFILFFPLRSLEGIMRKRGKQIFLPSAFKWVTLVKLGIPKMSTPLAYAVAYF